MDIRQLIEGELGGTLTKLVKSQMGIDNSNQAETAVDATISTLLNALSKNVSKPQGAENLANALSRDHDGTILDDVAGFLTGSRQATNPKMLNGEGILKHILGGNQNNVISMLSNMAGLDKSKASQMLATLAPVVLGMLGKAKNTNKLDQRGLADFIMQGTQRANQATPTDTDFITKILDKDGDGSALDDIASFGMKTVFGKIFK